MATWREAAQERIPEVIRTNESLAEELDEDEGGPYFFFRTLVRVARRAHDSGDQETLRRIYGFAAWCAVQEEKEFWNPVGVSFYEHLFDDPKYTDAVLPWISPAMAWQHLDLWKDRVPPQTFERLRVLASKNR